MSVEETKHYLANGQASLPDAREALEWARETTAQMVDLKFSDLLGMWQHMTLPIRLSTSRSSTTASASTARRSAAGRGSHESDMLLMPDAYVRGPGSLHRGADALADLRHRRPGHARALLKDPRRLRRPRRTSCRPASRTRLSWARRPSSSSSTRSRSSSVRTAALFRRFGARATGTPVAKPGLGYTVARERGLLPRPAERHAARSAHRHGADAGTARHSV